MVNSAVAKKKTGKQPSLTEIATYRKVRGIHFLRLKGTVAERAKQHAVLLRDVIRNGVVPVLAQRNQWMIRRGPGLMRQKLFHQPVIWAYENLFVRWLEKNLPVDDREVITVLARETGISERDYMHALFQPDGLLFLAKLTVMKHLLPESRAWRAFGCSSSVVPPDWSKTGKLLSSRNMDYPIVGPWEGNTTVLFQEPDEKDRIPHVAISSAGVHTAGLTAINREGLTLAMHAHFSRKTSATGLPGTVIGENIISRAKDINQAIDIAREHPPTTNWAFVVTSAKDRAGAVLEVTPDKVAVRHTDGKPLTHTNYFQTSELNRTEGLISGMEAEDLMGRNCRMHDFLEEHRGEITAGMLCELLGNHTDFRTGAERVVGNPLSVVTTVKSVVFEPEALKFWVSARPESPTALQAEFIGVETGSFWDNADEPELLPGYEPESPRLTEAVAEYRKAYQSWHVQNDQEDFEQTAYVSVKRAAEIYPADGHLWMVAGLVAFKLTQFDESLASLQRATTTQLSSHARDVCTLFIARCYDVTGDRKRARSLYSQFKAVDEPRLRGAMRKGYWIPYRRGEVSNLVLDLQFPDAIQY